ncbi:MAG: C40 family peptidase [Proteobacteria bacterium]|nr:C40 family peptidase [Pseudomonadota bacterium]
MVDDSAPPRLRVQNSQAQIVEAARSWIGTPYVHQASVKGAGCDCLGLLRGVWRELHGEEPETAPPYSPDWAEATGEETLYAALSRHLREIDKRDIAPGDTALFRMLPNGPAKHCGIIGAFPPPFTGEEAPSAFAALGTSPVNGGGKLTLIHARQNKCVNEEMLSLFWKQKTVAVFRL